jgi:ATP/maltotriose-dependent transcriptional regulator MalT
MPKLPTYILHWFSSNQVYELTRNGRAEQRFGQESSPSWFHFLETHTSIAFQGREGRLSVIKETRLRGAGYWYAYRTSGRRTVKRYLGSANNVTIVRLEEAAGALSRAGIGTQTTRERRETGAQSSHPTSLLLPKLLPPRLPSSLVERPRLLEWLDAALEHKLTLLVAPAGYGKTTIVNQWIHERQARLFLETGELQNALRILETHDLEEHMTARIVQARLRLSQGKSHEARHWLERLLPEALEQRQMHEAQEIRVLLSLAHAACQEAQQAQQSLRQALSQARSTGVVRLFLSEGKPLAHLLRQLAPTLQEPALRSYAQTLLRAFAQPAEADGSGLASSSGLLVEPLSVQEQRVLRLLAAGRSNREIAQDLVVSVNTVKDHAKHPYRKLGVSNRLQAGAAARHLKLI